MYPEEIINFQVFSLNRGEKDRFITSILFPNLALFHLSTPFKFPMQKKPCSRVNLTVPEIRYWQFLFFFFFSVHICFSFRGSLGDILALILSRSHRAFLRLHAGDKVERALPIRGQPRTEIGRNGFRHYETHRAEINSRIRTYAKHSRYGDTKSHEVD